MHKMKNNNNTKKISLAINLLSNKYSFTTSMSTSYTIWHFSPNYQIKSLIQTNLLKMTKKVYQDI